MPWQSMALHLAVCRRFGAAVRAVDGRWHCPTPCDGWTARDILEHVIGFHDVLLLRPMGLKPQRPRNDPQLRWSLTFDAVQQAFRHGGGLEQVVEVPAIGARTASPMDADKVVPRLSQDVLVHTWDLARAVGADDHLDWRWCALFLDMLPTDPQALVATGMFKPPVPALASDAQSQLLARLGRNPSWERPRRDGI